MVGATTVRTLVKKSLTFAGVVARMQYSLSMHRRVVPGSLPQQSPSTSSYADFTENFRQREAAPAISPVQNFFFSHMQFRMECRQLHIDREGGVRIMVRSGWTCRNKIGKKICHEKAEPSSASIFTGPGFESDLVFGNSQREFTLF